jgi:lipopolysaccharide export system protein LptA
MTPNAPVKNFRFPRFGENGYTQWVLQGERGIYDSAEQIRVEEMALRVYSGDERMAREMTLDSPEATIRVKDNRAFSKKPIKIVGANFTITGTGWEWIGDTKEIVVENDTVVEFTQAITGGLSERSASNQVKRTVIKSDQLVLQTTDENYHFEFSGSVRALSGEMDLQSNILIALADAPGADEDVPDLGGDQLDSVREIVALEEVTILHEGRTVRADEAKFRPRENRATLTGSPQIEVGGAFLSGAVVRSRSGELVIEGSPAEGRAQMILTETGGLGLQGISALSEQTIVLADRITMQQTASENRFLFNEEVEVMSGAVQLQAASMMILAEQAKKEAVTGSEESDADALKVGEVRQLVAEGGVRIEQEGQVATGERVVFYPAEERCELTGQPKVTNGEAVITGRKMELKPKLAIVTGTDSEKVRVALPEMPDLGYQAFTPTLSSTEVKQEAESVEPEVTIVRSQLLRMIEEPGRTLFRFSEAVEISATNLEASCERLDVIAKEKPVPASTRDAAERLEVVRIEAHEAVSIKQAERTATAERAFILPKEGKVVLEDNAVVNDERGRVSGYRMTLLQGERKAIVEGGGGPGQERARITLPELPGGEEE